MNNKPYSLTTMRYARNKLWTFSYIECQLWVIQETNFEHFVIQIDSNGLSTKQTRTFCYTDWQQCVIHETDFEYFVIQIDSNGLSTIQTRTFCYTDWQQWVIHQTNQNVLLYRLKAMGYPRNRLWTFCYTDWQQWVIHQTNQNVLLYRLTAMGYPPNRPERFVIQIDSNGLSTKQTITFCYTDWQQWVIHQTNQNILLYRLTAMGYPPNKPEHFVIQIDNNGYPRKKLWTFCYIYYSKQVLQKLETCNMYYLYWWKELKLKYI